jgi:hypothetical protein
MIQYSSVLKEDRNLDVGRRIDVVFSRKDKIVYRFKGFDSALYGDDMVALEAIVDAWMEEERPRIRHMCQSVRSQHILLSFVYEDSHELEQRIALQTQATAVTGAIPRIFDDEMTDDRPTNPSIPATPPPMH